jgi:hypothetical protein
VSKGGSEKSDALRKMREEKFAKVQQESKARLARVPDIGYRQAKLAQASPPLLSHDPGPAADDPSHAGRHEPSKTKRERAADALKPKAIQPGEGKCSVCDKTLVVVRDKVRQHQKGLGKVCPGSGKPPR